jgi:hypothetical protein
LLKPYWNIFHVSDIYLINKTFMFNFFLSGNKYGFAGNIWSGLSANIKIHVVTGIINETQKPWLPDIVEFTHFSFRSRTFITILVSHFRRCCIRHASFMISRSISLFLAKHFVWRFCFLAHRGHLQELKVCDIKLLYLSQLCGLKDRIINVGI